MSKQSYANHKRYYAPHHFIFLPLLGILLTVGVIRIFKDEANQLQWILFSITLFCILYLTIMVRQHYALMNQDRIVRLEFRLRYFQLTGKNTDEVERKLSLDQMAAFRFASDQEFAALLEKTIQDNLSPDEIKQSIRVWQPDEHRV